MTTSRVRRRPQLSEEVADLVGAQIMSGDLRPGDFVRLDETANALGVSVTPVREALLTLRGEGLVELVPRRGYVVCSLSRQDIEDVFWVQLTIARRLLTRAFRNFDDADRANLLAFAEDFAAAAEAGDSAAVERVQGQIYRTVNRAARSDKLARTLLAISRMPFGLFAADPAWRAAQTVTNREFADAARAGDFDRALVAYEAQYDDACRRLVAHLEAVHVWEPDTTDASE